MRKAILGAALLFVGCEGSFGYPYESGCASIVSEVPLQQAKLDAHIEYAKEQIDTKFWVGAFCEATRGDTIEVRVKPWDCMYYETTCSGESQTGHIVITIADSALVHEVIHNIEGGRGLAGTMWHEGWTVNGYFELDDSFTFNAPPIRQDFGP